MTHNDYSSQLKNFLSKVDAGNSVTFTSVTKNIMVEPIPSRKESCWQCLAEFEKLSDGEPMEYNKRKVYNSNNIAIESLVMEFSQFQFAVFAFVYLTNKQARPKFL